MQPPAVTSGLVAAVHPRFDARVQPRRRLGDAVGHLVGMPSLDDVVAHASSLAADADVPVLVASSKLTYRSLGLAISWSRRTVRVVAISMPLVKEWKAVLTRRRRTCQSYIASLGRPATNWE